MTENTGPTATPRDVFLHVGAAAALYVSIYNILTLAFAFINLAFPDPSFSVEPYSSTINWSIASLIVMFPLFLALTYVIHRDTQKAPVKLTLKSKRWITGITLFLAGAFIVGDLIAVIYQFLEGSLTTRFAFKVLTILIVASAVVGYYAAELKGLWLQYTGGLRIFAAGVVLAVVAMLAVGFSIMGSPQTQRELRLDRERIQDLSQIQHHVIQYWQDKGTVPASLSKLRDDIGGYRPPRDPKTDEPYTYTKTGETAFTLCAAFARKSVSSGRQPGVPHLPSPETSSYNWQHDAGEHCFERTIDPDRHSDERP